MEEAARQYITTAEQMAASGCYSKAFDLYILAFEKDASLKDTYEPEFRAILARFNSVLIRAGKTEEVFQNFGRAVKVFPDNIHIINETGKYLYQFGFYLEAWCHFQKTLKMDAGYVNGERNLNSIKNLLVERWHYRMLNDKIRNEAYRKALKEVIRPYKETIFDLGAGTGLLTLYCMECKPLMITICDNSEQMVKMAECIFEDNKYDNIIIINNMSTELSYWDIGGKRALIVTEVFDAGLFGENALKTFAHAHKELLSPIGRILPNKAQYFIIGAKCDHLNHKYQLNSAAKNLLNISALTVHIFADYETYDCEDVYQFKDMKYMTKATSLLKIDFNSYDDIKEKLARVEPYGIDLIPIENGEMNVIIGWFDLYLTDNVTLTTDPRSDKRASAWQQTVFYDFVPQLVSKDKPMKAEFLLNEGRLSMVPNNSSKIVRISPEALRFLNDTEYVNMITKCLGMASVYLGQIADMSQITIVDLCPFPLFGLLMLKRGAKHLTCCAKTSRDRKFFKNVFKANKISMSKINLLDGEEWSSETFLDEKYHAIFCNILDVTGDICVRRYEIAQNLKNAHLVTGGLFMPFSTNLMAQVVNSEWLDINNRVYDKNTSNYRIGHYINKYQVSQNFSIDLTCLEYKPLTDPVSLGKLGEVTSGVVNTPIIESGEANAVLSWYSIELIEDMGEISTKRGNSFVDATIFLANPALSMVSGKVANVLRCIDIDGNFKLMIDIDTT